MITAKEYQEALLVHCTSLAEKMNGPKFQAIAELIGRVPEMRGGIAMLQTIAESVKWQLSQPEPTLKFGLPGDEDENQFPPAE